MSKRWQYLTIELPASMLKGGPTVEKIQAELTKQGNLGWELVNMVHYGQLSPAMLIFKKEQ
ncbi:MULTISPECIES: DUF4177 domain-containing protein [unclassified Stenotrophomonas]|uniref:DUF4177 domain-containing protein n=1 Tax=unclassified Stenotrophomonas TaxID=196198 RepID=UPI0025D58D13|nr:MULTISPECIES: DUF4177 domain-containing protein [unclassified Stenotrophomonas]